MELSFFSDGDDGNGVDDGGNDGNGVDGNDVDDGGNDGNGVDDDGWLASDVLTKWRIKALMIMNEDIVGFLKKRIFTIEEIF